MSGIRIKDATPIDELQDYLLFAVGNTEGDTDGCVSLGQVKDFVDNDKAAVCFTGDYNDLENKPNLNDYVQVTTLNQNYYNKQQVNSIIHDTSTITYKVVDELPEKGEANIIYLMLHENTAGGDFEWHESLDDPISSGDDDVYDEYVWLVDGETFERIGSTAINFSNYYDKEEVDAMIPSVGNGTITITQDGVTKGTFTTNQSGNTTIAIDGQEFTQEQADWNESDVTDPAYIKNKPSIPTVNDTEITFTQGGVLKGSISLNQSTAETVELDGHEQADWTVEDPNDPRFIVNKPDTMELELTYDDGIVENVEFYVGNSTKRREYFYVKNTYEGQNIVTVYVPPSNLDFYSTNSYEWSKDKENWTLNNFGNNGGTFRYTLELGECLYLRNNNGKWSQQQETFGIGRDINISASQKHDVGGDIMSLLAYSNVNFIPWTEGTFAKLFENNTTLESAADLKITPVAATINMYYSMFKGCTNLIHAPKVMKTTSFARECCYYMFNGCENMVDAPELEINTVAYRSLNYMFTNCRSLSAVKHKFNATTLATECYMCMYVNCSNLTTVPDLSNATTLAQECYRNMLAGTAITTAPSLPVTTLKPLCYAGLFANCQNLTTAPILPATTLDNYCYYQMFSDSGLTTAPELPATTLTERCYSQMFKNCSNLNEITIQADDISATDCLTDWLDGVAQSGTFHNLGSATYPSGVSGIPTGWTETNS